ncbi:hypothetical protein ACN20G_08800 [Streptomyces sp. BI20]|uniref:hypothetical protein n=1 Tax=Streptomyces sp. BI20 TaxID=3403460 RepID=UPI003C70AD4E
MAAALGVGAVRLMGAGTGADGGAAQGRIGAAGPVGASAGPPALDPRTAPRPPAAPGVPDPVGAASPDARPGAGAGAGAGPTGGPGVGAGGGAGRRVVDPAGFTLVVPADWRRVVRGQGVFWVNADESELIQVFRVTEPGLTPAAAVRHSSGVLARGNAGYRELSAGPVPGADPGAAAELVYRYDRPTGHGPRRAVERVLRVPGDAALWAVLTAGPEADWPATRARHEAAVSTFRPTARPGPS